MHNDIFTRALSAAALAWVLAGCGGPAGQEAPAAPEPSASSVVATPVAHTWPASLNVVGGGFPAAGDPCRIIGETTATVDYLDDSATLVGCLDPAEAERLGGRVLTTVDGVTLVSVPNSTG